MDYSLAMKFLATKYGKCYNTSNFYNNVAIWSNWYKGYVKDFHLLKTSNGITAPTREMYKLKMASRVSKDWASAVLNEDVNIVISSTNNKSSIFIQGSKCTGGVLGSNNFIETLSTSLERMFALGTSALVIEFNNLMIDENGKVLGIVPNTANAISLSSYTADSIIPISWSNGIIRECAFITERVIKGKSYFIVSTHVIEEDGYVIYNDVLNSSYQQTKMNIGVLPIIRTGSVKPLFTILKTNVANNIDFSSPMGVSIFSDSIDTLRAIDSTYDKCVLEPIDGQRIIMMNKNLLTVDDLGRPIVPQDARQHYMQFFGDEGQQDIANFIKDFTPELRTEALDKELQNQLNILSCQCGLGTKYYNYDSSGGVTATEYAGERQDFIRNAKKMSRGIAMSIKQLIQSLLWCGKYIVGADVNPDAKIVVNVADGIVEDDSKERETDRQDVKDGIMSKVEYRMKWYGETEDEASKKLSSIEVS